MRGRTVATGAVASLAGAAAWRARDVPFSPVTGGGHIGAEFVARRGLAAEDPALVGEMDDMAEFARPDFDPERVAGDVRRFYERTTEYEMLLRARWHRPFRKGARLAAPVTTRIRQLNLPGPSDEDWHRLGSEFVALDPDADPRDGARAWIRTDESGAAVFVALYASHECDGERFVNIAAPLPGGNLSTVLRIGHLGAGDATGVELTTRAPGDPGLYWVTPPAGFALPADQRFRVWPTDGTVSAPAEVDDPTGGDAVALATHEMWLCGAQFLTVEYAVVPA
ncbi:hypothetical protein [Halobacterium sp. KA-6]|uniref:hypothetical protein n=1 Tax=Halobacterium sp. KA-6 TaxID=2896368 RepID=UPI001E515C7D|nr:hypothetical protein [Halobacterium sp. KA-6]MCD2202869.1 hypothetical protein [Halobacterium sp. KA-6]